MKFLNPFHISGLGAALGVLASSAPALAQTAATNCADVEGTFDVSPDRIVYGAGGSAATATIRRVAQALLTTEQSQRILVFYRDHRPACEGYSQLIDTGYSTAQLDFRYWDASGAEQQCKAPATKVVFGHMGNTPALCPGSQPLPAGFRAHIGPVQTLNFIVNADSEQSTISAEALYHIFGFGPGASGKSVAPWTEPNALFGRPQSAFVHQLLAAAVRVPASATKILSVNSLPQNQQIADAVAGARTDLWAGDVQNLLGYVSGSTADDNRGRIKTLAYQHFDQSCAYLPDSTPSAFDKANVRSGQYFLNTPGWLYTKVDSEGDAVAQDGSTKLPIVDQFVSWFTGTSPSPEIDVSWTSGSGENAVTVGPLSNLQQVIIKTGDVPICAVSAIRPKGDLTPLQSFQPESPCNGFFEQTAQGSTEYESCDDDNPCTGENEKCSYGYCELTYPASTD